MDLLRRVEKARGRRVLSALSGGADSVALTLLLIKAGAEVTCAHFEHGIRGADSLRDRDFCRAFCKELHVPLLEDSARVPENRMPGEGLEQAARRLRYRFLRRAKESVGAEWIALAHHMDDQAETVLMHLLRGSGLAGVAGMRELSGDLYRPLLGVRKRELLEYLEELGQSYCQDASNWIPDTPRNLLRLRVMPELESAYPGCVEAIARFSAQADRDEAFFDALAENWLSARMETGAYGMRVLAQDPGAQPVVSRAMRQLCRRAQIPQAESRHVCALTRLLDAPRGKVELPGGRFAERAGNWLYFPIASPPPEPTRLIFSGESELPGLCRVLAKDWEGGPVRDDPFRQALSCDALKGAVLRTRRAGDWIQPLGMEGKKLLSDYLIDRSVDRPLRDWTPLIAIGNEILWVVGVGISQKARLLGGRAVLLHCIFSDQ